MYYKWEIVDGKDYLPEKLQDLTFAVYETYDDEITEAITSLVPDYFEPDIPTLVKIQKR